MLATKSPQSMIRGKFSHLPTECPRASANPGRQAHIGARFSGPILLLAAAGLFPAIPGYGDTINVPVANQEQHKIRPVGRVFESYGRSEGDHFLVRIDMLIDANLEQVRNLLTDYAHLDRLSSSITGSKLLYNKKPHYRVRVVTDNCIVFYCRQLVQVQDVTELKNGFILVRVLPESSDFSYGQNLWRIQAQDGGTRVTYSSDLVPNFWVPPIVGTAIFQHELLEESRQLLENLARLANSSHDSTKK
jgi:hypothetical protein